MAQSAAPCATYDFRASMLKEHPELLDIEAQLEKDINSFYKLNKGDLSRFRKTADTGDVWYDIPVVVHVIHDYGTEMVADNAVYNMIAEMNKFYSLQNNVSSVIDPFKPYIGDAHIRFHLATKDPLGNPTKGITHRFSYLTYRGDDQAKFDQWNPASYLNLWSESVIGRGQKGGIVLAYSSFPSMGAVRPYWDGVMSRADALGDGNPNATNSGGTMDHEVGHYFNLAHTFGAASGVGTNKSGSCVDDDGVDDTPPTQGHLSTCSLYDTVCAKNYFKLYPDVKGHDSLANYPDTANEQNIMNYASCTNMFTKGQVARMHAALNSEVGKRDSLWTPINLSRTGALAPMPDLKPIPDFAVKNKNESAHSYFACPGDGSTAGTTLNFISKSWGDTVIQVDWSFTNGASTPTSSASVSATAINNVNSKVSNTFSETGWASVTLAATGNNSGTTTTTFDRVVYVTEKSGTPADGYFMDFNTSDTAKWPIFNYYGNEFRWKIADVGTYDNNSIQYTGYDIRGFGRTTGSPMGDYDDFFSLPMDLTSFGGGNCHLNYFYSGASRSSNTYDINDQMEIAYSIDRGNTWKKLDTMRKGRLINRGAVYNEYTPTQPNDWSPMSLSIPSEARTAYTVFRFRYMPSLSLVYDEVAGANVISIAAGSYSTSNNFFMDRIHFSSIPAATGNLNMASIDVAVVPNPTSGDAYVVINDAANVTARIIVTDVTGKQVYAAEEKITGKQTGIRIPQEAIAVKGMYMVQAITGNQSRTLKLVSY